MDFNKAAFGLDIQTLSEITGLHPSTLRRYKRLNKAPAYIVDLILFYRSGRLPTWHQSWNGWRIVADVLIDPDGNQYRASDIRQLPYLFALQREFRKYREIPVQFLLDV